VASVQHLGGRVVFTEQNIDVGDYPPVDGGDGKVVAALGKLV